MSRNVSGNSASPALTSRAMVNLEACGIGREKKKGLEVGHHRLTTHCVSGPDGPLVQMCVIHKCVFLQRHRT